MVLRDWARLRILSTASSQVELMSMTSSSRRRASLRPLLGPRQPQHPLQKLLQPVEVLQRGLQPGAIFFRASRTLQQRLQGGLQHRHRRLQLVRGVSQKFPLLLEGVLQPSQHLGHRFGQGTQFLNLLRFFGRLKLPALGGDQGRLPRQSLQRATGRGESSTTPARWSRPAAAGSPGQ